MRKIKINKITPNPDNPRLIKDERFRKLVENIKRYPKFLEKRPIVIDSFKNPVILGGNMRYKALLELGYKEIPETWVKEATGFTEEEKKAFIILDNVEFGESDWEKLANEWDENDLQDWGLELPFNFKGDAEEDDYVIPDEIETDIVTGDLFEIGQHRLLCGDSTNADDVGKVMDNCKPILMVTDPPYGVKYNPEWRDRNAEHFGELKNNYKNRNTELVNNDDEVNWFEAFVLFAGDVVYLWHAGIYAGETAEHLLKADFEVKYQIIWNKPQGIISRGDYNSKHEPCWYAVRKGAKHNWKGDNKQVTVWDIAGMSPFGGSRDAKDKKTGHSTQKPVECMARPIRNNTYERETVYDPFLGSGTTMVAAHQLNRKCIGIEISPQYCQIIVDRMLNLDASLEVKRNGKVYKKVVKKSVDKQLIDG